VAVRDVVARLGPGLVAPAPSVDLPDRRLCGVAVYDPLLELREGRDEVLLAVGVDPVTPAAIDVIARAGDHCFSAVVFHAAAEASPELVAAAREHGVALLLSPDDVSWAHLAAMLRVALGPDQPFEVAGVALGDLFAFANQLAADVGGAVTIEDPQSRVLAYSGVEADVDEPRKETILGREVPRKYTRLLQERGVFRRLASSDDVVHMEAVPDVGLQRRVAIGVRAAGELLGSIWVAEAGRPLASHADAMLREGARTAALHIVRQRLDSQHLSTLRRRLVLDLLEGTDVPDVLAVRLRLDPDGAHEVLAFEPLSAETPAAQLLQAIDAYCVTFRISALTVDVGPRVYVILPLHTKPAGELRRLAADTARRAGSMVRGQILAAIGSEALTVARLPQSRADADRVMRVLLRRGTQLTVADLDDVRAEAGLLEILDVISQRDHLLDGRLRAVAESGDDRGTVLLETLQAYLDHFGDVSRAAEALQVHPNTFRYRLRRAAEVTGMDLNDPAERLMASLQLRLLT
jgi:hypothetical protein